MEEKGKTAIICIGGGMRSAHGAGFLFALATKLGITSPDIMVASSGGAGNMMYFAAGQYESLSHIWNDLLPYSRFISPFRIWRMLDVDYLIDTVFKVRDYLDLEALRASSVRWFISATDFDSGISRYFSSADEVDPFEALRASKAIPVFFGKRIALGGRRYFDGELGPTVGDHVRFAASQGATRIFVLDNAGTGGRLGNIAMGLYALLVTRTPLRKALLRDISALRVAEAIPGVTVHYLSPSTLPVSTATRNPKKIRAAFDQGAADALALESELRTLLA